MTDQESGEHLTFEAVRDDVLDLLKKWVAVLRTTVADIGNFENDHRERSTADKAVSRWQMYLGTMIIKASEGVMELVPSRNVRAMAVLMRAVYEYQVKAEYFLADSKNAEKQLLSVTGRRLRTLSKLGFPPGLNVAPKLAASLLQWKRDAGAINEESGQVPFKNMQLAIARAQEHKTKVSKVKTDAARKEYTEEYTAFYSIASWYTHGDVSLVPEVFRKFSDDTAWDITEDRMTFDEITTLAATNALLSRFVLKTCEAYGFGVDRMLPVREQLARTISSARLLHLQNPPGP